jgi:hypothetical protein
MPSATQPGEGQNIIINCDNQATIFAMNSSKIKSKTTNMAISEHNKLGENNNVLTRQIPAKKVTTVTKKQIL